MLNKHGHPTTPKKIAAHYSKASRDKRLGARWNARIRLMRDELEAWALLPLLNMQIEALAMDDAFEAAKDNEKAA